MEILQCEKVSLFRYYSSSCIRIYNGLISILHCIYEICLLNHKTGINGCTGFPKIVAWSAGPTFTRKSDKEKVTLGILYQQQDNSFESRGNINNIHYWNVFFLCIIHQFYLAHENNTLYSVGMMALFKVLLQSLLIHNSESLMNCLFYHYFLDHFAAVILKEFVGVLECLLLEK